VTEAQAKVRTQEAEIHRLRREFDKREKSCRYLLAQQGLSREVSPVADPALGRSTKRTIHERRGVSPVGAGDPPIIPEVQMISPGRRRRLSLIAPFPPWPVSPLRIPGSWGFSMISSSPFGE